MELYLVRHGETYGNIGQTHTFDPHLTPVGVLQADWLGKHLKDVHFDKIYASHLTRAIQTAAGVARYQCGNPDIVIVPELAERGTPIDFEADISTHKTVYSNLIYTKTSIGKNYHGDIERAEAALLQLVYRPAYEQATITEAQGENQIRYNPEKILIVAHGAMNACMLSSLINFRFDMNMNIENRNTCVNRFSLFLHNGVPRKRFISYNDISHLPPEMQKTVL